MAMPPLTVVKWGHFTGFERDWNYPQCRGTGPRINDPRILQPATGHDPEIFRPQIPRWGYDAETRASTETEEERRLSCAVGWPQTTGPSLSASRQYKLSSQNSGRHT